MTKSSMSGILLIAEVGWANDNLSYYSKNTKLNVMEGYFMYITYRFKDDPILARLAKTAAYAGA